MAVLIRFSAAAWSEMSEPFATALPPASVIAATVSLAGPESCPERSTATPRAATHHGGPPPAQQQAPRPADTPPGAGHDRYPPVQSSHASPPFLPPHSRVGAN